MFDLGSLVQVRSCFLRVNLLLLSYATPEPLAPANHQLVEFQAQSSLKICKRLDLSLLIQQPAPVVDSARRLALRAFGSSMIALIRRMCRGKEVFDSLPVAAKERAHNCMQRLDVLVRQLQRSLLPPSTARSRPLRVEPFRPAQADVLLRASLMGLRQRMLELLDSAGTAGPWPSEPESDFPADGAAPDSEAALMRECHEAASSLAAMYDRAAAIAPAEALRTLVAARRQFGAALLRRMGVAGNRIAADVFEARLRALFADFDAGGDGWLDRPKMAAAMAALGVDMGGAAPAQHTARIREPTLPLPVSAGQRTDRTGARTARQR